MGDPFPQFEGKTKISTYFRRPPRNRFGLRDLIKRTVNFDTVFL